MMSVIKKEFKNIPVDGMKHSTVKIMKNTEKNSVFIRETFPEEYEEEPTLTWLSDKAALELATWILDNVSEVNDVPLQGH